MEEQVKATYTDDLLVIDNVSKMYEDVPIVKNISHVVRDIFCDGEDKGQVIGILGKSGSGKTTIIRMLAGLEKPTTGSIKYRTNGSLKEVEPGCMGVVTQKYIVFDHRTVLGNLILASKQNPATTDHVTAAREALARYLLEDKADLYPDQLSGGQKQRVAIARQTLTGSKFLCLDEPCSGLDPIMIEKVCRVIKDIATADGLATTFVVTHDVEAAVVVSDMLLCLGHDYDKEKKLPGAYIKYKYNLAEMGLAWREDISETQEFHDFMKELYSVYHDL
jgi:ABC-type polar amino acid transport system ATPase subunit